MPCNPQVQSVRQRVARLDADGTPSVDPADIYIAQALVSMQITPVVQAGEEMDIANAAGTAACGSWKDFDRYKRWDVTGSVCTPDATLASILQNGTILNVEGIDVPGYAAPALNVDPDENGISMELWARRIARGGGIDPNYPFAWWALPRLYIYHASITFENGPNQPSFRGWMVENTNWGDGPGDDWPEIDAPAIRAWQWIPTTTAPDPDCPAVS